MKIRFDLDSEEFVQLCTEMGIEATYEIEEIDVADNEAHVEVTMETLRPNLAYDFLTELENVSPA
ncbi:MAG: hypothetical protein ABEJ89_00745 [Haloarculaceae archaeon]